MGLSTIAGEKVVDVLARLNEIQVFGKTFPNDVPTVCLGFEDIRLRRL